MAELDTIRTFYGFNATVRHRYLETIVSLPRDEQLRDRGASHPSLLEIYGHVLDALTFWFDLVPNDRVARAPETELRVREVSPEGLRDATAAVGTLVNGFLGPLQAPDLARELVAHFPGEAGPVEERFRIGDVLWHMVEEELQHRGELNALLWQLDVEPPLGTFEMWERSKVGRMYGP